MYLAEDLVHPSDSAQVAWSRFKEMLAADPGTAMQQLGREALQFGLKVLLALVLYFVGAWVIKRIKHAMERYFQRKKTDRAMASFISSFVSIALTVLLIVVLVGTLGINTTSLAALLAAGGMALGMALSGTVQNFAGGLMLMIFKPFKAGDYIEAQGYAGVVTEVTIVGTHLTTIDNRRVVLPNGALSNGNIVNYSSFPLRRIDLPVSVEYGTDAAACKEKLLEIVREDARILDAETPGAADPFVAVQKLSESSVNFIIRAWVKGSDYWPAQFDLNERIYTELPQAGIKFPFPQLDVHVHQA
ncbi:MAG: mechanosensitive ion channel [Bacteroidales bacterium]|jgi:small conductance mechanosensitive channel|nr:mechanosensitive ion channel [Bacteroidales bacterium]